MSKAFEENGTCEDTHENSREKPQMCKMWQNVLL
jgi:hypothetical protein